MGEELRGQGTARRLLPAAALLGLTVLSLAFSRAVNFLVAYLALTTLLSILLALRKGPTVLVADDAIVVRTSRGERRYELSTIVEASWAATGFYRSGPALRLHGKPFDMPGPNQPIMIAAMFMPGKDVRSRFAAACRERGVPYAAPLRSPLANWLRTRRDNRERPVGEDNSSTRRHDAP